MLCSRGRSSAGRAPQWHCGGQGFKSPRLQGERLALTPESEERGLYVHVPYCLSKCNYCALASAPAAEQPPAERYVGAVLRELEGHPGPFATAFVGGGTPTALPPADLRRLLAAVRERLAPGAEFTVETNPAATSPETVEVMAASGATRVSVGVQAAHAEALRRLGRGHDVAEAETAVSRLRAAGLRDLNVDLIFGHPEQTEEEWIETLDWVVALDLPHAALYDLSIEAGTPFARAGVRPDQDLSARLYEAAIAALEGAGFLHYEVSNFARWENLCRHNLGYWLLRPYVGVGAAAHSYLGGVRRWNAETAADYVALVEAGVDPIGGSERLEGPARAGEALALVLRLVGGLSIDDLPAPLPEEIRAHRGEALEALDRAGLVEWADPHLAPTRRGVFLLDEVCAGLV